MAKPQPQLMALGMALFSTAMIAVLALAFMKKDNAPGQSASASGPAFLTPQIRAVVARYPLDGTYPQLRGPEVNTSMGVTEDLFYQGRRIMKGQPNRASYCIGITFEVYWKACEQYARENWGSRDFALPGIDHETFKTFRREFYGVDGNRLTFVRALADRNLGQRVGLEQLIEGDLVQFWREDGTGHSVIFHSHERDEAGKIIGLRYWSSQSSTKGLGYHSEYFADGVQKASINGIRPHVPVRP
jgi:hypothetical protein